MGSFAGDPLPARPAGPRAPVEDACGALVAAVLARTEWRHGMPRCAVGRGAEGAQDGPGHGMAQGLWINLWMSWHCCAPMYISLVLFTIKLGTY